MKNEEIKTVNPEETKAEEATKTPKMRTKIHIRNPFVAEKIEVPAKEKKAKKAKEPKPESEKKGSFLKGFGAGFAAGSAITAGVGVLGAKRRKDAEEDEYEVEEDEVDEADSEDDDDSEDSEDSDDV